jgi:hypothetical protein
VHESEGDVVNDFRLLVGKEGFVITAWGDDPMGRMGIKGVVGGRRLLFWWVLIRRLLICWLSMIRFLLLILSLSPVHILPLLPLTPIIPITFFATR